MTRQDRMREIIRQITERGISCPEQIWVTAHIMTAHRVIITR